MSSARPCPGTILQSLEAGWMYRIVRSGATPMHISCGHRAAMNVHVGTSGWSYAHWQHMLYAPGTPPGARLDHFV